MSDREFPPPPPAPSPPTLFDPPPADPPPTARPTDPTTSHQAAAGLGPRHPLRAWILTALDAMGPLCDATLAEIHNAAVKTGAAPPSSTSGLRTRRAELVDSGHIAHDPDAYIVLESSNRRHIVWHSTGKTYPE